MSSNNSTDCIVLHIEEYDNDTNKIDSSIFILYDVNKRKFIIRGKRGNFGEKPTVYTTYPYSFTSKKKSRVIEFLKLMLDTKNNYINITLFNYDNLPATSNEITYRFLNKNVDKRYEMTGYDKFCVTDFSLRNILNVLKSVYNNY